VIRLSAVVALLLAVLSGCGGGSESPGDADADADFIDGAPLADAGPPDGPTADAGIELPIPTRPVVILMIGDGMGPQHLLAASHFLAGAPGQLFMERNLAHGKIRTGNLSGTVDSAAAATTMSTGVYNYNGSIGVDRDETTVEVMVERAHRAGLSAGIVSNAWLQDASPAGFSAHADSRAELDVISSSQLLTVQPDVMLGGGEIYADPLDLTAGGYQVAGGKAELAMLDLADGKVAGYFSNTQMPYVLDRLPGSDVPTLTEMSLEAIRLLDSDPDGFFLMIEGALIDKASHLNGNTGYPRDMIEETIDFDKAVIAVAAWAQHQPDATLLITADHECGGLLVVQGNGPGVMPTLTWRWSNHTNSPVDIFSLGNATAVFEGKSRDQRWVFEALASQIERRQFVPPPHAVSPDGDFGDLPAVAASQLLTSNFTPGNRLDELRLGSDADGLGIGVGGLFQWGANTVVLYVDKDFGAATGVADPSAISDSVGTLDQILGATHLTAPPVLGFGADYAIAARGGDDPRVEDVNPPSGSFPYPYVAGMRSLTNPAVLTNLGIATNFADGTRLKAGVDGVSIPGQGWEVFLPWKQLYGTDLPPAGAKIAVVAVLVDSTGATSSNQALPSWPIGTADPGANAVPLPGVVVYDVDSGTATIVTE
jgi:alkaline phosphatase